MKTATKFSALFLAIALAGACSSSEGPNDNGGNDPVPGDAYLTVVGDSNVFLENGWRQTISVRYHDGSDQPLAGEIEFSVVGSSNGGTISAPASVTNADGVASIDVLAGAEGEAVFTIRADAAYADGAEWTIAVSAGDPPLPPLDVTGRYTVHSELDLVSGVPGTAGDVINNFIEMTDDPYDPATWLIDLVLAEIDNSTVDSLAGALRPALDGLLNDLLLNYAPDFITNILDVGNKFGQVARNFGVVSTLDVEEVGGVEGDELGAVHTMTGMFFNIDSDRYSYSMADLGLQNQAVEGLSFRMENENKIFVGEHTFAMPYGAMLLVALNDAIIPMVDPYATDISSLLLNLVDCESVGDTLAAEIGFLSAATYEGACQIGITAGANFIEDQVRSLEGMDLNLSTGEAKPMDTNTDALVDVLLNGLWSGDVNYFGAEAVLTDATFRGERQNLP